MTDKRKDEMPDEIYIFNKPIKYYKKVRYSYYTSTAGYKDEMTKYTRAHLSPPVPDDVAEAIAAYNELISGTALYPVIALCTENDCYQLQLDRKNTEIIIRAASTPSAEVRALRDIEDAARVFCQVISNADFDATERQIGYEVLKGALDAYEALNHTGGK